MPKKLTLMKNTLEALGFKQLDVYRVVREKRYVDVVRVKDPASGKVVLVDLDALRDSLDVAEFVDKVVSELSKAGVKVDERRLSAVKAKLSSGKSLS